MAKRVKLSNLTILSASLGAMAVLNPIVAQADDFPKWDQAITMYNEAQCCGLICPDTSIGGKSTQRGVLHGKKA